MRKRILLMSHSSGISGACRSLLLLAQGLDKGKFDITVAVPREGQLVEALEREGIAHLRLPTVSWVVGEFKVPKSLVLMFFQIANLWRSLGILRSTRFDLVHCNTGLELEPAIAARILRIPVLIHCRQILKGNPYGFVGGWRAGSRIICGVADRVICVSMGVKWSLVEAGCEPKKMLVVHNCIDIEGRTDFYGRSGEAATSRGEREEPIIGFVGRINAQKGVLTLIEAFALVKARHRGARLVVVGGGKRRDEDKAKKLTQVLGLEKDVDFLGEVTDVAPFYRTFTVLAVPSRVEAFGGVFLEAAAHAVPSIGGSDGGTPEIIEDGVTGYTVPPGEVNPLADAIMVILDRPAEAREMGRRAREKVAEQFTVERTTQGVERVYEEMLSTE